MATDEMKLIMGEKEVDLAKCWPLNIKDIKAFKAAGITDEKGNIDTEDIEHLEAMLLHLCQKVNPEITGEDVELIDIIEINAFGKWMTRVSKEAGLEVDRPT